VRPWINRCLLLGLAGMGLLAVRADQPLIGVAVLGATGFFAVAQHRTVVELVLDGDRLILVSASGRRTTLGLDQIERFEAPTSRRAARLVTTDGTARPLQATGALIPMLDLIDERRPGAVDDVRPAAERAHGTEEKQAIRRDRFPWVTPLMLACTMSGLLLACGWLLAAVLGGNAILDRAVLVDAAVLGVEPTSGDRVTVSVEYRVAGEIHRADLAIPADDRPAPGDTIVVAVDPEDPEVAWGPGGRPLPPMQWWAMIGSGILLCAGILLAPTALAEHPTLTPAESRPP
jgi:hypothetical protein